MNRIHRHAAAAVLLLGIAAGHATESPQAPADIDALKATYLACDRASTQRRLDADEVVACSTASEQLLKLGFGGDFDRLLAWWRGAKGQAETVPPTELARRG